MAEPFNIVLFGGAGDLALRKLLPALYRAQLEGQLNEQTQIIASCLSQQEVDGYLAKVQSSLQRFLSAGEYDEQQWLVFASKLQAIALDISKFSEQWSALAELLASSQALTRVYYLAIPPSLFAPCCEGLHRAGAITEHSRVVVEKPLGYDGVSAAAINDEIARYFAESSIFRIDHYLGKETVQNLMALRFSNVLFEQLWDATTIDHIQISISETVGLEGRASFYENAGALRDMVQNHLLQLLCLVAMESPNKLSADNIRREKVKVLEALRPLSGEAVDKHVVRGQYVAGNINNSLVPGYLEELGQPHSNTETFVAIRAHIDNWRWSRVPFYLRTGKRLAKRSAEIVIQYKDVSHNVYPHDAGKMQPNRLIIRLQPEEAIQLTLMAKDLAEQTMKLKPVTLNLDFADTYSKLHADAYKRLMLDAAANNASLFIHREEVAAAWAWIDPIIAHWQHSEHSPHLYRAGSYGPKAAEYMLAETGHQWFNPQQ